MNWTVEPGAVFNLNQRPGVHVSPVIVLMCVKLQILPGHAHKSATVVNVLMWSFVPCRFMTETLEET